jgi:2-keto-4-pentenoate hydratase/2-oxohepta-3-ene-1,7-dioic acid hydratase in catechol pathway
MLFPVRNLIHRLSGWWTLRPGDIIFTGTPSGVGPLKQGDQVGIESSDTGFFSWTISF